MKTTLFTIVLFFGTLPFLSHGQVTVSEKRFSLQKQFTSDLQAMRKVISGHEPYQPYLEYVITNFEAYTLLYQTKVYGKKTVLSGTLLVPKQHERAKENIVVFCHGTSFDQNVASNWTSPLHIEALPAMNNYITFLPDYAGYGENEKSVPTYMLKKTTVKQIKDFIVYGLKALEKIGISSSRSISLLGFSQGGHAVLALAEDQSKKRSSKFELKSLVSIGGPTHLNQNLDHILKKDSFSGSAYLTYIFGSYNHYHFGNSTVDYFSEPYDILVSRFQEKKVPLNMLKDSTSTEIKELMNSSFRLNFLGSPDLEERKVFNSNSVFPFISKVPIHLIHGEQDQDVPFDIAKDFYKGLLEKNASGQIRWTPLPGTDHIQSGLIGMKLALDYFNSDIP